MRNSNTKLGSNHNNNNDNSQESISTFNNVEQRSLGSVASTTTTTIEEETNTANQPFQHPQINNNNNNNKKRMTEFWLDLRGTAVMPMEAITILETILFDASNSNNNNNNNKELVDEYDGASPSSPSYMEEEKKKSKSLLFIDRILVSEELFFRIIQSPNKKTIVPVDNNNSNKQKNIDLFYATMDGTELVANLQEQEQSIPAGKIIRYKPDSSTAIMVDPMVALDTVTEGGWILMEPEQTTLTLTDDNKQTLAWMREQVAGLFSFLSNVANAPRFDMTPGNDSVTAGGLFLPSLKTATSTSSSSSSSTTTTSSSSINESDAVTRDPRGGGGVAISVRTKAALYELHTALAEAAWCSEHASMTSTTASGILIPTGIIITSSTCDGVSSTQSTSPVMPSKSHQRGGGDIRMALVLPLDVMLWKGVMDLELLEVDNNNNDDDDDHS